MRAVRGTSGITAGLLPLPTIARVRCPRSDGEVLDVRAARFGHPQAVEAKQHSQCGVHRVVPLSGEQEGAELGAVHPVPLGLGDLGAANVVGGVGEDATVDVGEPVVATHRGQPPIDRRGRQASLLHRHSIELDVASGRRQRCHSAVAGPLEEPTEIVPVGVEGSAAVAGQERDRRQVSLIRPGLANSRDATVVVGSDMDILLHWTTTANATSTARRRRLQARPGPRPLVTAFTSTTTDVSRSAASPAFWGSAQIE